MRDNLLPTNAFVGNTPRISIVQCSKIISSYDFQSRCYVLESKYILAAFVLYLVCILL